MVQKQKKTFSEQQFCREKCLVNERGQRRRASQVEADRKVTATQITEVCGRVSEYTTVKTLKWIGYSSRRLKK